MDQGGRYAFAEAAHNLRKLSGLEISAQHVMRLTERLGGEWAAQRDADVTAWQFSRLSRTYAERPAAVAVMLDGGRVQTRQEPSGPGVHRPEWKEPKCACLLTLKTTPSAKDPQPDPPPKFLDRHQVPLLVQQMQHVRGGTRGKDVPAPPDAPRSRRRRKRVSRYVLRTVIATMAAVGVFGPQVAAEVYRRGFDLALRKGCVCDGGAANWTVYEEHLKPLGFVAILDFLHLLGYLYGAAYAAGGGVEKRWNRYVQWMTWAWRGERNALLLALNAAVQQAGPAPKNAAESDPRKVLERARTYVINNSDKMDYPRYRRLGLPVSSAPVESSIKQLNRRIKGTEKFWRVSALENLLQVTTALLSQDGRWDRLWNQPRPHRVARTNSLGFAA